MSADLPDGFFIKAEYEENVAPGEKPKFLGYALYRGPNRIGRFATRELAVTLAFLIIEYEEKVFDYNDGPENDGDDYAVPSSGP